jgi:hypothetical protein
VSLNISRRDYKQICFYLVLGVLAALGLWLRWRFAQAVHLYPDEFVTLLAIKMIGESGLPVMPSGLFYEHGLFFSYLGSLATVIHDSYLAVRLASVSFGAVTLLLCFWLGRRWFSQMVGLIAMAGLTVAPSAIHWSGRARMYSLLQLLVLLALWLAYTGLAYDKPRFRWTALVVYFAAILTHFVSVSLAPPLVLAALLTWWFLKRVGNQKGEISQSPNLPFPQSPNPPKLWPELLTLIVILLVAFLVKRAGQPKGIEVLEVNVGSAVTGLAQVFSIYSDFSFNFSEGWQAIAPFYLSLPALIFTPFAILATLSEFTIFVRSMLRLGKASRGMAESSELARPSSTNPGDYQGLSNKTFAQSTERDAFGDAHPALLVITPGLFLSLFLAITTFEMILFVSPERRDDKYLFMLLPILLLLGAKGMAMIGHWILKVSISMRSLTPRIGAGPTAGNQKREISPSPHLPISPSPQTIFSSIAVCGLIIIFTWPEARSLLNNTGDDYDAAFAYVQEHWQAGDTILTGTPAAAAFYLGRNDFYSVQRRGGYDYRVLNGSGRDQPVDRWLASPAIRTESDLHQTLANHKVWLVLERWGLQREYYDLPFLQQLLAQTDYVTETQGIFVLHSKANPKPIGLEPAHLVYLADGSGQPVFGEMVQLIGCTVEPAEVGPGQSLRLTLYWQALAAMPADYTVFVHLRDPEQGGNVAQADHRPLGNLFPTTLWPVGEMIRESSDLSLPVALAPGDYDLWVGLYFLETGERLPVQDDTSGENAVWLGRVRVEN